MKWSRLNAVLCQPSSVLVCRRGVGYPHDLDHCRRPSRLGYGRHFGDRSSSIDATARVTTVYYGRKMSIRGGCRRHTEAGHLRLEVIGLTGERVADGKLAPRRRSAGSSPDQQRTRVGRITRAIVR